MKRYAATIGLTLSILLAACGNREHTSIIPAPLNVELQKKAFTLNGNTRLWMELPDGKGAYLKEYIDKHALGVWSGSRPADNAIVLELADTLPGMDNPEGYVMRTDKSGVRISALSEGGLFYGIQTLLQMTDEKGSIAHGVIVDEPRFEYRGMMLDVSRHFFGVDFIKKQIEAMAYYKLNHLHLHLTDAAGWRIEIKRYPELTRQAAWRTHALWKDWWNGDRHYAVEGEADAHGGYYTCLLYTSPSPRDRSVSRMPSSA